MRRTWMAVLLLSMAACGRGEVATTTTQPATTTTSETIATTTSAATTSTEATTTSAAASCSAAGLEVEPQEGLPEPVAATRTKIAAAASACDFEQLASLAGDEFTYSFGDSGDPATYWRAREEEGEEPLRYLVELLDAPYSARQVEGAPTQYVWPSAFAYPDWESVPEEDRRALEPLYGEDDFASFEQFGGYIGYRIGITEDGEWLFFVAGD